MRICIRIGVQICLIKPLRIEKNTDTSYTLRIQKRRKFYVIKFDNIDKQL